MAAARLGPPWPRAVHRPQVCVSSGLPDGASLRTVGHMATLTLHDTDIDELTAVLRRLAPTIARIETACTPARFGRPRDWTITGMLAVELPRSDGHGVSMDQAAGLEA